VFCSFFPRKVKSKSLPRQAEVAQGVPGSLRPRIILTFRHYKDGRSSAIRTGCLYLRRNPWYSFSRAESTPWHMVLSEGTTEIIPSDTIGNRSRDCLTSSAARFSHVPAVKFMLTIVNTLNMDALPLPSNVTLLTSLFRHANGLTLRHS
jgi:hypothetical protein